jgi:hypothetical protein
MTIDRQQYADARCYAFAREWLTKTGWHNTVDVQRLAEAIQSTIEDFEADLANDLTEVPHD